MSIESELRELRTDSPALDPARVIAGARRRRRRGLLTAAAASAGVAGVAVVGLLVAQDPVAVGPPVAATPSSVTPPVTPSVTPSRYVFQNTRPAVVSLAAGVEVKLGPYLSFKTKGTQWAVISRRPGEPVYEPFGWRQTVGNANIGDGADPGLQISGNVVTSVFRSQTAVTVVYTSGRKAWYGQVRRLAGIPGWVAATAALPAVPRSVFAYDADGKLVGCLGDPKDDPLRG
ncbi:hypothetical protein ACIA58_08690 [Kribbella sp. NPDC051586]|uniref:hypothetical protein n=1 Tax=Kribbella sp. NPDC051586 TaxID=3364118 RepID=UPI0037A5D2A8